MVKQEISEYERQRQANIAERDALLKKLALDAASAGIAPKRVKAPSSGQKPPRRRDAVKRVKEEVVMPRRTSSRLAGLEADSDKAQRKAEEEYEAVKEAVRVKRQRVSGDMNLQDIIVSGSGLGNEFADVVNRGANPYERTFGETEVRATSDKQLKSLREKMSALELYDGFEPNSMMLLRP